MDKRTRIISLAAIMTALSVVFLYLASFIPTVRLGFAAAASLFAIAAVIESGIVSSVFVFIGTSIISTLLLPDKTALLIYVLFFGYYPIVKSLAERIRSAVVTWIIKLGVFEVACSVIWFLFKNLIFNAKYLETNIILVYLFGTAAFVIFDIGLTRLIGLYIMKVSKNIKKNNQ